jgi:hypothetical protein
LSCTFSPMNNSLAFFVACSGVLVFGALRAQNPEFVSDPWEVRMVSAPSELDADAQRLFRHGTTWMASNPAAADWQVVKHLDRNQPSRMWGAGQAFDSPDTESRALEAWTWALEGFGWNSDVVGDIHVARGAKHERAFASQVLEGWPVLGSKFQAKFHENRLVLVSSDWWPVLVPVASNSELSEDAVVAQLESDMAVDPSVGNVGTTYVTDFGWEDLGMAWLPVQEGGEGTSNWSAHPVWQLEITGRRGVLPVRYLTWVDMVTGAVVMRVNQVVHEAPAKEVNRMGPRTSLRPRGGSCGGGLSSQRAGSGESSGP